MTRIMFFIIYSPTVFEVQSQRPLKLRNQLQRRPNQLLFLKLKVDIYSLSLLLCLLQHPPRTKSSPSNNLKFLFYLQLSPCISTSYTCYFSEPEPFALC